jgi:hypothetical protein
VVDRMCDDIVQSALAVLIRRFQGVILLVDVGGLSYGTKSPTLRTSALM